MKRLLICSGIVLSILGLSGWAYYAFHRQTDEVAYTPDKSNVTTQQQPKVTLDGVHMIAIVNQYRANAGVAPLAESEALDKSATQKCQDMVTPGVSKDGAHYDGYIGHDDPNGVFTGINFLRAADPTATYWDENIINWNFKSDQEVIDRWYNETGKTDGDTSHRTAILNSIYTETGIAYCTSAHPNPKDTYYVVVEHFANGGSTCRDGWHSSSVGQGTCSYHQGIAN